MKTIYNFSGEQVWNPNMSEKEFSDLTKDEQKEAKKQISEIKKQEFLDEANKTNLFENLEDAQDYCQSHNYDQLSLAQKGRVLVDLERLENEKQKLGVEEALEDHKANKELTTEEEINSLPLEERKAILEKTDRGIETYNSSDYDEEEVITFKPEDCAEVSSNKQLM